MAKKYDRTFEKERLMDYANDVAAMYFRYMYAHKMDMYDEQHPFARNRMEADRIERTLTFKELTPKEMRKLETRLDELRTYFHENKEKEEETRLDESIQRNE